MENNKTKTKPTKKHISNNTPTKDELKKAEKEVKQLEKQQKNWNNMVEEILYPDDQLDDEW